MKTFYSSLALGLSSMLLFCCNTDNNIKEYNLSQDLHPKITIATGTNTKVKLDLCDAIPFKWDKIVIIPSYTTTKMFRKYKFKNSKEIEEQLPVLVSDENQVLLLFIHRDNIMNYSLVPALPLNFNVINNSDVNKVLNREIVCEHLYVQKVNENLTLFYN